MQELQQTQLEGIKVLLNEADVTDIQATVDGPGKLLSGCLNHQFSDKSYF
jgi:hypothetical protein